MKDPSIDDNLYATLEVDFDEMMKKVYEVEEHFKKQQQEEEIEWALSLSPAEIRKLNPAERSKVMRIRTKYKVSKHKSRMKQCR